MFENVLEEFTAVRLALRHPWLATSCGRTLLGIEEVKEMASVKEVDLEEARHMLERDPQPRFEPQERQDQVGDQCQPDVGHDGVLRGAQEGLDLQMLFHRFEEQLDLPPLFVKRRHRGGAQMEGIGPEHVMFAGFRGSVPHSP